MMRPLLLSLSLMLNLNSPQVPILNARVPDGPPSMTSSDYGTKPLGLTVAITDLAGTHYLRERFEYEIELTNSSTESIWIPWSTNPSWDEAGATDVLEASVWLTIRNPAGREQLVGATYMYGRQGVHSSVLELQPGASARVALAGKWSFPGINPAEFLQAPQETVTARAVYALRRSNFIWTPQPSPIRELVLMQ
jgi:hypothetical protein